MRKIEIKKSHILCALAAAAFAWIATSCSGEPAFLGNWQSAAPSDAARWFPGAANASSQQTFRFADNQSKDGGVFTYSSDYSVTESAEQHYNATASVSGSWTYDVDDDDDLLLTFDMKSLRMDLESPSSSDSIGMRMMENARHRVEQAMMSEVGRYTVIEDIEVSRDKSSMTFETKNPEEKHHFRKMQ